MERRLEWGLSLVLMGSLVAGLLGCGSPGGGEEGPPVGLPLKEALHRMDVIHLEEVPGDTIGEVGAVHVMEDGTILVADRLVPRLRSYDADGGFRGAQGGAGEGPFEYRGILDAATDFHGRVLVQGMGASHLTVLTPDLRPDTLLPLPDGLAGSRNVLGFGEGVVLVGPVEGRTVVVFFGEGGAGAWSRPAGPEELFSQPYWSSVTYFHLAVGDGILFVGNSLLYPIRRLARDGTSKAPLGSPPSSFRPVPELEAGALAFTGPGPGDEVRTRLAAWLDSFTVIAGLHVVQERWLVVVHGRLEVGPTGSPSGPVEYAFDVYDLTSEERVLEDVLLPDGARILAGGPALHVLVDGPPGPWTIERYRIGQGAAH